MPKRFWTITMLLIAGAIVNIAVAWGLVAMQDLSTERRTVRGFLPTTSPSYSWAYGTQDWGRFCLVIWRTMPNPNPTTHVPPVPNRPWWSNDPAFPSDVTRLPFASVIETAAGWPVISLYGRTEVDAGTGVASIRSGFHWNQFYFINAHKIYPFSPLWPGFTLNTFVYAAVLWLLLFARRMAIRAIRVRRRLCPACAYPVGTSPVCTECGTQLPNHVAVQH